MQPAGAMRWRRTGTVYLRMALPVNTVVMTCDVLCGPQLKVKAGAVAAASHALAGTGPRS